MSEDVICYCCVSLICGLILLAEFIDPVFKVERALDGVVKAVPAG
jgi:hypothetical protein